MSEVTSPLNRCLISRRHRCPRIRRLPRVYAPLAALLANQPEEDALSTRSRTHLACGRERTILAIEVLGEGPALLREFLYVDSDKVRSMVTQIAGGVDEEVRQPDRSQSAVTGGLKGVVSGDKLWSSEESTQRSVADIVFQTLEAELESQGYLADISDEMTTVTEGNYDEFMGRYAPGTFIRATAPARLFDARYLADTFAGLSATLNGLARIHPAFKSVQSRSVGGGRASGKVFSKPPSTAPSGGGPSVGELEDQVADFPEADWLEGLHVDDLRAYVRIARGVFRPGVHVMMGGAGTAPLSITARLQEGRRFLDSDVEVLFARYGTRAQELTIVGTIGNYAAHPDSTFEPQSFTSADRTNLNRPRLAATFSDLVGFLGVQGLVDAPTYPGMSVVPFAVYRSMQPQWRWAGGNAPMAR